MAFRAVTPAADDDAALMLRVQDGDRQAFGVLVGRYEMTVVNYLTRLTRDRSRAEELAQEAFLRLYERASRYQERGQLLPYLLAHRQQSAALRGAPVPSLANAVGPGRRHTIGAGAQPGAPAALGRGHAGGRGRAPGSAAALPLATRPARDRRTLLPRDRDRARVPRGHGEVEDQSRQGTAEDAADPLLAGTRFAERYEER